MSKLRNCFGRLTLVELTIIIVVLGILAAVAIPKYEDIVGETYEKDARAALGSLRSGISIYYGSQAVNTGTANWPPIDSLRTVGVVMLRNIPENPYQKYAPDSIVIGFTKGEIVGTRGGWAYNPKTGEIWLNTNTIGENKW